MQLARSASVYSNGVSVKHEICRAMEIIDGLHETFTDTEAVFTSIVEGKHKKDSLHYMGMAVDVRIWYIEKADRALFVVRLRDLLGPGYKVILERDHIHVSFRPNR